jgi:hypothetical protein
MWYCVKKVYREKSGILQILFISNVNKFAM